MSPPHGRCRGRNRAPASHSAAAGQSIELARPWCRREARGGDGDVALEHPGETVALLGAGLALAAAEDGAGDVGGAVQILRAGIDEIDFAGLDLPLGSFVRVVVDDGAVRPRPGNGGKAQPLEKLILAAEGFEFRRGGNLIEIALRRFPGDPGQKAGQRRAVAHMGGNGAAKLDRVLAGLGQRARVAAGNNRARASRNRVKERMRRFADRSAPLSFPADRGSPQVAAARRSHLSPRCARTASDLAFVDEKLGAAVGSINAKASAIGVNVRSRPRMFSSQLIESGAVRTAISAPASTMAAPISARLSALLRPAKRNS